MLAQGMDDPLLFLSIIHPRPEDIVASWPIANMATYSTPLYRSLFPTLGAVYGFQALCASIAVPLKTEKVSSRIALFASKSINSH